jgi:hypothetical protein
MWAQLVAMVVALMLGPGHLRPQLSALVGGIRSGLVAGVDGLPNTSSGIHVALPMLRCFRQTAPFGGVDSPECAVSARKSIATLRGKIDLGWMWTYGHFSPPQLRVKLNLGASLQIDRFPAYVVDRATGQGRPQTLGYWQRTHPSWIEYTCAVNAQGRHTTPAWEYGNVPATPDRPGFVPFDIDNPQARQYVVSHYVLPSLQAGFRSVFFDNVSLSNHAGRCGHYGPDGRWHQDYSKANPLRFRNDMLSWLSYLRDVIHGYAPGAMLAVNYNPAENNDPPTDYQKVFRIVDIEFEEGGFTDWGFGRMSTRDGLWPREFRAMSWMAAQPGKALVINGITGAPGTSPSQVTVSDREWVIANYLLVKGSHTYTAILPSSDYGYYVRFPEYYLRIGVPKGPAYMSQGVWMRRFTRGLVIVNPTESAQAVSIGPGYLSSSGVSVPPQIGLSPTCGMVLLNRTTISSIA